MKSYYLICMIFLYPARYNIYMKSYYLTVQDIPLLCTIQYLYRFFFFFSLLSFPTHPLRPFNFFLLLSSFLFPAPPSFAPFLLSFPRLFCPLLFFFPPPSPPLPLSSSPPLRQHVKATKHAKSLASSPTIRDADLGPMVARASDLATMIVVCHRLFGLHPSFVIILFLLFV